MRYGLPLMLGVSIALHLGVVLVVAVSGMFHRSSHSIGPATKVAPPAPVVMLQLVPALVPQVAREKREKAKQPQEVASKPGDPSHSLAATAKVPNLARPNKPRRAPEEVLNPSAAPHLDGKGGVVFILDISGSMYEPYGRSNRLHVALDILAERIQALKEGTPFALTLYGERAHNSGPLVPANEETRDAAIRFAAENFDYGGGTNLPVGFFYAMELGADHFVLVTDGDLNMRVGELLMQTRHILGPPGRRPSVTIIGIAPRSDRSDDITLQALSEATGGDYSIVH